MTFASDVQKSASERFFLVRISPRKYIGSGLSLGSNQYYWDIGLGYNISKVTINETDSSSFIYENGDLVITSLIDLSNSSNIVTFDHDLYLTGTKVRSTASVSEVPDADWIPLIQNYPEFSQSMKNIAEGVFSLSGTDISLICTDRWGQNLLGSDDSLSRSPVTVWVCIDSVESNRRIFDGEVASVNYSYGVLSVSIIDSFQKLGNTAAFGIRSQSHVYTGNNGQYPLPQDENSAVPIVMGKSSPYSISAGYRHVDPFGAVPSPSYHLNDGMRAKLIGPYSPNQESTTTWMLGRIVGTDVKKINFGSFTGNTLVVPFSKQIEGTITYVNADQTTNYSEQSTDFVVNYIVYCQLSNIDNFNGEIGDYIPASYLTCFDSNFRASSDGGFICGYGAGLYGSYNLAIYVQNFTKDSLFDVIPTQYTSAALSIPSATLPSVSMWVESGEGISYNYQVFYLVLSLNPVTFKAQFSGSTRYLPFTLSLGTAYTVGGKTVRDVYATVTKNSVINISGSSVRCRISPNQSMTHGEALKFVCKASGLDTNDTTFTQADSELTANVSLTVPKDDAAQFPNYLDVAQSITSSTLGVLRVNQSRQVEYELLKNPSSLSIDSTKDVLNMVAGDTVTSVEYQDIYSTVEFKNPQLNNLAALSGTGPNSVVDFPKIRQLHRVNKTKTVEHVLESIQNRKSVIAGYFSNPTVEYSLSTASEDLASSIGDIVEINNTAVANDEQSAVGLIIGLDQSGSKTTVKINELRGIE